MLLKKIVHGSLVVSNKIPYFQNFFPHPQNSGDAAAKTLSLDMQNLHPHFCD
jgi:hypothetical protein